MRTGGISKAVMYSSTCAREVKFGFKQFSEETKKQNFSSKSKVIQESIVFNIFLLCW